ncbi:MAG: ABC transporter permease [Spirochaetes bacterium]|nr:MAG: ABC transporter permease [Spirochaetota bacterium]
MGFIFVLMSLLIPGQFLRIENLQSMAFQLPELGLLSLAMMITMLTGGIDLSIIATANLTGIVTALILKNSVLAGTEATVPGAIILLAVVTGLFTALIIGLINGLLVAVVNVSPILATLGTMTLVKGLAIVITKGYVISGLPNVIRFIGNGVIAGIPVGAILFTLCALLMSLILNRTPFGFSVYMLGSNPTATYYSGINNKLVLIKTYLISSLYAGFAALIMISRFNSAKAGYGESYLLVTILVSVLGGTSATGGFGKVSGLVLALIILQFVSSGLNLLRISSFLTITIWGLIIIFVMIVNYLGSKYRKRGVV